MNTNEIDKLADKLYTRFNEAYDNELTPYGDELPELEVAAWKAVAEMVLENSACTVQCCQPTPEEIEARRTEQWEREKKDLWTRCIVGNPNCSFAFADKIVEAFSERFHK
jgi:hypothetical protein